jgi:hypothetical protein
VAPGRRIGRGDLAATAASPRFKQLAEALDPQRRDELHAAWAELCERHRTAGRIRLAHGHPAWTSPPRKNRDGPQLGRRRRSATRVMSSPSLARVAAT